MCFLLLVSPRPTTGQGRCFCSVDWHCSPKVAFHSLSTTLRRTTRDCFLYASCINPKRSSHAQKNGGDSNPAFCNLVRQFRESLHAAISCRRSGFLILIGSIALVLSITGTFSKPDAWALTGENLLFLEAWRTIDRAYIDKTFNGQNWFTYRQDALKREPMNNREQTYTAIRKMLASLEDPFTRFLEPEKFKTLQSGTKGMVTGVGLEVGFESNSGSMDLIVIAPVAGGPADRAGILSGDVILAINGIETRDMSLYDAARGLQGPENSHVELTVRNKMSPTPKTFMLQRQNITLNPVTWHLCEHTVDGIGSVKIGYIRLGTFNQNSAQAVREAISQLKQDGAMAYVLDIRNNSGGLFPAGIAVAKLWLEKGVIVYICDSMGIRDIYEADGNGAILTREPLAVLVNKGTASASEILAGALKDNKRAMILGEQTFGKGKIQSVFELSDGSGMAVTTARYETPMHTDIDKVGIMPDYVLSPGSLPMEVDRICECLVDSTLLCRISSDLLIC